MTPDTIIPLFGMVTGIVMMGIIVWGGVHVARGPIGHAIARWFGGTGGDPDPALLEEVEVLRGGVARLEGHVAELEERLDFAERMLAQRPESARLGEPRG
ncbi:MAG TPA: hypothetical protein VJ773_09820 [Gemmatimonadales bacterium]|nr:hypothetical protein [Gemmatimonadales bacterium]